MEDSKRAVNKTTAETSKMFKKTMSKELDNIAGLLEKLEPKQRIETGLLPYIVPKQSGVSAPENKTPLKLLIKVNRTLTS